MNLKLNQMMLILTVIYARELRCILELKDRHLVTRHLAESKHEYYISIHRLLQRSVLLQLNENELERQKTFDETLHLVRLAFPRQSHVQIPQNENWILSQKALPHAMSLLSVFETSSGLKGSLLFAELLSDVGNYLWEQSLLRDGLKCLEAADTMYQQYASDVQYDVLEHSKIETILGCIHLFLGPEARTASLKCFLRSLERRNKYFSKAIGSSHSELNNGFESSSTSDSEVLLLANAYNDVACVLVDFEDYEEAEIFLLRSIEIKRNRGLKEESEFSSFCFAANFCNMSMVYIGQGKLEEAVEVAKHSAMLYQTYGLGREAGDSVNSEFWFQYAIALFCAGRIEEALEEHEKALKARIEDFGEKGINTLNSLYHTALALFENKNPTKAM